MPTETSTPTSNGEPGGWIAIKVALFIAVPCGLIYLAKVLLG